MTVISKDLLRQYRRNGAVTDQIQIEGGVPVVARKIAVGDLDRSSSLELVQRATASQPDLVKSTSVARDIFEGDDRVLIIIRFLT